MCRKCSLQMKGSFRQKPNQTVCLNLIETLQFFESSKVMKHGVSFTCKSPKSRNCGIIFTKRSEICLQHFRKTFIVHQSQAVFIGVIQFKVLPTLPITSS